MRVIKQRIGFITIATGIGVLASVNLLFLEEHRIYTNLFGVAAIILTLFMFGFLILANKNLKSARLIIENQILHIQPIKFDLSTFDNSNVTLPSEGIEVFVSCFGILLDSKVVKFNLDGIHLKAVQIGREFIVLTYGTDQQTKKIRILHESIGGEELQIIVERFRYETGVIPIIIDQ